jgi:hypothetical protein
MFKYILVMWINTSLIHAYIMYVDICNPICIYIYVDRIKNILIVEETSLSINKLAFCNTVTYVIVYRFK